MESAIQQKKVDPEKAMESFKSTIPTKADLKSRKKFDFPECVYEKNYEDTKKAIDSFRTFVSHRASDEVIKKHKVISKVDALAKLFSDPEKINLDVVQKAILAGWEIQTIFYEAMFQVNGSYQGIYGSARSFTKNLSGLLEIY